MFNIDKAKYLLCGACTAAIFTMAGCEKAPDKAATTPQAQSPVLTAMTPSASAGAASQEAPPLPDNNRTDPEAAAMRKKFFEWKAAQHNAAAAASLKQLRELNGDDKPKGN
jgi:hypothetical protein